MSTRSGRIALTGRHGERYSWVYWAATVAGFAFLIVDIFDDSALWNYAATRRHTTAAQDEIVSSRNKV
jgi:hypothetical protein